MRILYVPVDRPDRRLIRALRELNHLTEPAAEAADALAMAGQDVYGAIVVDGAQASPQWAAAFAAACPEAFLILVAREADSKARAAVLRAGADACFVGPVHIGEISGKLDALARRRASAAPASVSLSPRRQAAIAAGAPVALSRREYLLLELLSGRPGEVVSIQEILDSVWGGEAEHDPAAVRTCLVRLRRKLEPKLGRRLIRAERGLGYVYLSDGPPSAAP